MHKRLYDKHLRQKYLNKLFIQTDPSLEHLWIGIQNTHIPDLFTHKRKKETHISELYIK